jgi:serine phosphatase RsbU (regulator of sigma subunit)
VRLGTGGGVERLGTSGLLLGIDPTTYETSTIRLERGERVFFFTDGADPNYDHAFAEQLTLHRELDLEDQVGGALGAVIELDAEGRPEDDVTAVAFEIVKE